MAIRAPLTREDWIKAAQQVLVDSGVDAVRVDNLAKEMKITRGSFYYHFKSRNELLEGILVDWRMRATESVIKHLSDTRTTPFQRLHRLLELPFHGVRAKEAASIEMGIRAWARRDRQARQAIDEVDNHRLRYIEGLLEQIGVGALEAVDRAQLIYAYQLSLSLVNQDLSQEKLLEQNARIIRIALPEQLRLSELASA
ncbi:HTH-type transcriptional repressor KstR2 [compost metagenome]